MMSATELTAALSNFTGSETYRRHALMRRMVSTDGVQFLEKNAGAYWLTDLIASHQLNRRVRSEPFQVWSLHVRQGDAALKLPDVGGRTQYLPRPYKATAICTDGNGNQVVKQNIHYTDFPLPSITLYAEMGSVDGVTPARVVMLPGER
jgi:hypothetical protein